MRTLADEILKRGTVTAKSRCRDTDETLWVDCECDFFNFRSRQPVCIECTNQCAHARADHQIRLDAVGFEHFENTNMCEASRSTPAEHQRDVGTLFGRVRYKTRRVGPIEFGNVASTAA